MTTLTENFYCAGGMIIARLQDEVAGLRSVTYAPSLDSIGPVLAKPTPAVFVIPGPLTNNPPTQTWYVVLHERNVADIAEATGVINSAGALLAQIATALAPPFVPGEEFSHLFFPSEDHRFPTPGQGLVILTYATQIEPEFWPYG